MYPIPFIVGSTSDEHKRNNKFVLKKFDLCVGEWREIHSFAGYREGHSVVQVGHYLFVLGGEDLDGALLNKVKNSVYVYTAKVQM